MEGIISFLPWCSVVVWLAVSVVWSRRAYVMRYRFHHRVPRWFFVLVVLGVAAAGVSLARIFCGESHVTFQVSAIINLCVGIVFLWASVKVSKQVT